MNTVEDVLAYIEANAQPGEFCLVGEYIRTTGKRLAAGSAASQCPICWVGTKTDRNPLRSCIAYVNVARTLGLDFGLARAIANAADNVACDPVLRVRLLKACKVA